jgi:hypothetical protein
MPAPVAAKHRAPRREVVFGLIRGWNEHGPDAPEVEHLDSCGFARWLERGRLTDGMIAELLLDRLATLDYLAADHGRDPRDDRAREIEVLMRWLATGVPDGIDRSQVADCLEALRLLDHADGARHDNKRAETIEKATRAIAKRFPAVIATARNTVTAARTTTRVLVLDDEAKTTLLLGERARLLVEADALRAELGERFLDPHSSPEYRAARVRKWRQLAVRESVRRQPKRTPRLGQRERMLGRVSRGMRRQAIESAFLRGAVPELREEDERRAPYINRFSTLSRKSSRRARWRMSATQILRDSADKPGDS